ncbi:hypothetical protein Saso_46980 [Streptomyces asoensis]|uniref:Uncharacterized protein n=2 Tax=Streptomyces asoensis TaxID=249586 RepID=A0ABQ3RZ05_9ACTN|nr:hypothetical protein GCM10010496_08430 [Streptomyces asoensis]GHI61035.1 hypothetical protein Saso_26850 [Streptomyces asoensis]GHI63048.1 hypothetical protein Saso_46980 [Streptomyces asoensis]
MNPQERSLRARLAAHTSWANTLDPASRTAKARAAAAGRFEKQARELHPGATDEQIARAAEHLKRAHAQRMALASAKARRAKKAAAELVPAQRSA